MMKNVSLRAEYLRRVQNRRRRFSILFSDLRIKETERGSSGEQPLLSSCDPVQTPFDPSHLHIPGNTYFTNSPHTPVKIAFGNIRKQLTTNYVAGLFFWELSLGSRFTFRKLLQYSC